MKISAITPHNVSRRQNFGAHLNMTSGGKSFIKAVANNEQNKDYIIDRFEQMDEILGDKTLTFSDTGQSIVGSVSDGRYVKEFDFEVVPCVRNKIDFNKLCRRAVEASREIDDINNKSMTEQIKSIFDK